MGDVATPPGRGREEERPYDIVRTRPFGSFARMLVGAGLYTVVTLAILNNPSYLQSAGETSAAKALPFQIAWLTLALLSPVVVAIASVATALIGFRFRLALDLFVTVAVTGGVVFGLNHLQTFLVRDLGVQWQTDVGPPLVVALAIVAYPYFQRRGRGLINVYVSVLLLLYVAIVRPSILVAVGEVAIGLFCGNLVALVVGVRYLRVNEKGVRQAIEGIGIKVRWVEPIVIAASRSRPFVVATPEGGDLLVKVIGAPERDADWVTKMRRRLLIKGAEDDPIFTTSRLHVGHEGFVATLARDGGVRTPRLKGATVAVTGEALLLREYVSGERLDKVDAGMITDEVLEDLWKQVSALHTVGLAHRELRLDSALLDPQGNAWIIDLGVAEYGVSDQKKAFDVAELLASTAIRVGAHRAVAACAKAMDREQMHNALRVLVPTGLTRETKREARESEGLIDRLREVLAGTLDADPSERIRLSRVEIRTLIQVIGLGLAMYLLLPQLANFRETIGAWQRADGWLLVGAFLFAVMTYPMNAVQLMGSVPGRLPFWWTVLVPVAAELGNRVTPGGVGGMAVTGTYLRKAGYSATESALGVTLTFVFGLLVNLPTLALMFVLASEAGRPGELGAPEISWGLIAIIAAFILVAGIVTMLIRRVRQVVIERVREAGTALREIVRRPKGAALLLGGSFGQMTAYVLSFLACLYAFGVTLPPATAIAIYLAGAALGQLVPTPGGVGGVEALLIAGLTGVGVQSGPAVAAVLTFRLFTYWLPTLPSVPVYRVLVRAGRI